MSIVTAQIQSADGQIHEVVMDQVGDTNKYPIYKMAFGPLGNAGVIVSSASPLPVRVSGTVIVDGSGVTQPVSHDALTELAAAINSNRMDVNVAKIGGVVDSDNSTSALLLADATFTGTAMDVLDVADVSVNVFSDVASATDGLMIEWSSDGTNWDENDFFTIGANNGKIFAFGPRTRYMRVVYTNGGSDQGQFRLQTILRSTTLRGSSHRVADLISAEDDAELVLSVTTGQKPNGDFVQFQATAAGNFKFSLEEVNGNVAVDADTGVGTDNRHGVALIRAESGGGRLIGSANPMPVEVEGPLTSFGELTIAEPTPVVQLQFPYNINTRLVIKKENNAGTVTQSNDHAVVSSGTSSSSAGTLESRTSLKYNAGQGALTRFTGLFTTGVANSLQGIGIGSESDGFFFGYNGTAFGVLRRRGGSPEIQTLTISVASTNDEDITITLDGVAETDVTVTDSSDATVTAKEIADHDYGSVGNGWKAKAVGNTVVFISFDAAAKAGSFTLTDSLSSAGTFAETVNGVSATDSWIAQTAWNVDKMDGTGPSGQTLDPTKGNVYKIQYQWLGYGPPVFFVEQASTGKLVVVHFLEYSNANTSPSISNPTLPLCMFAINTSNTTDMIVKSSSIAGFVEGKEGFIGIPLAASNLFTIGNVTAEEPVLTIRVKEVYQGRLNRVRITPTLLTMVSNLNAAQGNMTFRIYIDAIPTNGTSYSDVDSENSVVEQDVGATDLLGGELQSTFILAKEETSIIDLSALREALRPGTIMMVTAQPSKGNASNEAGATINWKELF